MALFRFLHFCTVFFSTTEQKTEQCVFVSLFYVFRTTVPFFAPLFRFFHNRTKKEQCVFVSLFHVFVPLFCFLHHCSVFSTTEQKWNSVFLYHCFLFCTTVPFFPQKNKKKTGTVCFCITVPCFRTTVPFFAPLFHFFTAEQKTEQCVFVPLFRFLHFCSVFPQQNKKWISVFSITTVKLLSDETEQQMETEHPMHEYSFINLITSTPKSPELLKDKSRNFSII